MTKSELIAELAPYPDDIELRILPDHDKGTQTEVMTTEHIIHTSETAYIDRDAPELEWDSEEGKVELGDGKRYLLFNPVVL